MKLQAALDTLTLRQCIDLLEKTSIDDLAVLLSEEKPNIRLLINQIIP